MRGGVGRWTSPLVWAVVVAVWAGPGLAQVRPIYGGRALDANPQLGSAGRNRPVPHFVPNSTNYLITGNVTGGRAFRGFSPIRDSSQLFVGLPSSALTNFRRDSVSVADVTAGLSPLDGRPYFAPEQTVTNAGAIGAGLNQLGSSRPRSPFVVPRAPARRVLPDGFESLTDPRPRGDLLALPPLIGTYGPVGVGGAFDPYGVATRRLTRPSLAASLPWPVDPLPSIVPTYPTQPLGHQPGYPGAELALPLGRRLTEPGRAEWPGDAVTELDPGLNSRLSSAPFNTRLESQIDTLPFAAGALPPAAMPIETALALTGTAVREGFTGGSQPAGLGAQSGSSGFARFPGISRRGLPTLGITGRTALDETVQPPTRSTRNLMDDVLGVDSRAPFGFAGPTGLATDEAAGRSRPQLIGEARSRDDAETVPRFGPGLSRPIRQTASRAELNRRRTERLEALLDRPLQSLESTEKGPIDAYLQAAEARLDAGEYYRAASRYDRARVIDPRDPRPLLGKGHALIGAGDYLSAAHHLQRGILLFPGIDRLQLDLLAMMPHEAVLERRRADLEQRLAGELASADRVRLRFLLGYIELYSGLDAFGRRNLSIAAEEAPAESFMRRVPTLLGVATPAEAASPPAPPRR